MRVKIISLILLITTSASTSYSQLTLNQLIALRLGETFQESKPKIKGMFSQTASIMREQAAAAQTQAA